MAEGAHDDATLRRYAEAQARLEHAGGWAWRDRAAAAVRGLGFVDDDLDRPLGTFSGGELTRASLARALAGSPDLLLLDEPTNHLDVQNLEWLERELETIDAAVILVAHDRWFLEAVTTSVLELSPGGAHYFSGPWHEWRQEKAARGRGSREDGRTCVRRHRAARALRRAVPLQEVQGEAGAGEAHADRPAREGAVGSAQEIESLTKKRRSLGFDFLDPPRTGRIVLEVEDVALSAGDKRLLDGATIVVERGEKVGLVGPNGAGKTTLLAALLDGASARARDDPARARRRARLLLAARARAAHDGVGARRDRCRDRLPRPQAQTLLGRFLFSGWETHERSVTALSGGERRRLALALLVASGANFLVLDEPTNHLDVESREALEAALEAFPGTIVLVSHDRALLDAVPDRIVAFEDRMLRSYDGGWADMERERDAAAHASGAGEPEPVAGRSRLDRGAAKRAPLRARAPRGRDRWRGGADRRARAQARRRLDEHGRPRRPPRRARRARARSLARWEVLFDEAHAT